MSIRRASFGVVALLMTSQVTATAQQPFAQLDSARAQIHTSLQRFYFNLAHRDWVALTADILPAKVMAHRPFPETRIGAATVPGDAGVFRPAADDRLRCSSKSSALVGRATITFDGDWAQVSVPRCAAAAAGADEFRLIHFGGRWRFIHVDLSREPVNVSASR